MPSDHSSKARLRRISALLGLTICTTLLTSCLASPYDGKRVTSRSAAIDFGGYVVTPAAEVRVLAWNYRSTRYDIVGTTRSVARASHYSGSDWYRWDTSLTVGDDYWEPGNHGASVKFKTEFDDSRGTSTILALAEDPLYCSPAGRSDDLPTVLLKCSSPVSPELVLCTEDYEPLGSRRGECTRRLVKFSSTARTYDERFFPARTTQSVVAPTDINYVNLRADRASFVDVFQRRLDNDEDSTRLGTRGIAFSKFIRLYYTEPNTSEGVSTYDLRRLGEGFALLDPRWTDARGRWDKGRSVRSYDRGECSVIVTWENINQVIATALEFKDPTLLSSPRVTLDAHPDSDAVLDPILRMGDAGDAFHFVQTYYLSARGVPAASLRATLRITAALRTIDGRLNLDVEKLDIDTSSVGALLRLSEVFGGTSPEELVNQYRRRIQEAVETQINGALATVTTRMIGRIYGRPEGYEIVLAESQDTNYALLIRSCPNICNRPARTTSTFLGYFDAINDPPRGGAHPILETDAPILSLTPVTRSTIRIRIMVGGRMECLDAIMPL